MTTSPGALALDESLHMVRGMDLAAGERPAPEPSPGGMPAPPPAAVDVAPGSPVDSVQRALEAIAGSDEQWRAWAHVDRAGAESRAAEAAEALAAGRPRRRLEGLPLGVKDVIEVANMPCAAGFAPFAARVPSAHAGVVDRLVAQGAIVVGKTVTTQFAFSDPAPTVNPWDPARTPGGSSSGSAVAVAVGHVPAALGTQTSGSTIRPASYNGIVGFKPSRGRLALAGVIPLAWSIDEVGILARTVEDCAEVFRAAATGSGVRADGGPLRVGLLEEAFELASTEVARSVADVGRILAEGGADVVPVRLGLLRPVAAVHKVVMTAEIGALHAHWYEQHPSHYSPMIANAVEEGLRINSRDYLDAQRLRQRLDAAVIAAFTDVDVWLLPSVADVAPMRGTTGDRSLQIAASLLGLPAVSIPSGLSGGGLPIGAQIVAAPGQDELVLAVATAVTRAESWAGRLAGAAIAWRVAGEGRA